MRDFLRDSHNRPILFGLLALLVVAVVLRVTAIDFGMPVRAARPDEGYTVGIAMAVGQGHINPGFFDWPSLNFYLTFFVYAVWFVVGFLGGQWTTPDEFGLATLEDPTTAFVLARLVQAAFGTGAVLVIAILGRRAYNWRVGFVAGAILAVAFLPVRNAHFAKIDISAVFWSLWAFLPMLGIARYGRTRDYILSGILIGLAVSSKYNSVLLLPSLLVVHVMARRADGVSWRDIVLNRRINFALVATFLAFAATSPFVLLDFGTFLESYGRASAWATAGEGGRIFFPESLWRHITVSLRYGMGLGPMLVGLLGLAYLAWRRKPLDVGLVLFAFLSWIALGLDARAPVRHMLPVIAVCVLSAAIALTVFIQGIQWGKGQQSFVNRKHIVLAVVTGLLLIETTGTTLEFLRLASQPDTRAQASAWIQEHVPDGATILLYSESLTQDQLMPPLPESLATIRAYTAWDETPGALLAQYAFLEASIDQLAAPRYDIRLPEIREGTRPPELLVSAGDLCLLKGGVDYVVLGDYYGFFQLHEEDYLLGEHLELQLARQPLAAEFIPLAAGVNPGAVRTRAVWDQPGFFAPLTDFAAFEYMGPRLRIVALDDWRCQVAVERR